MLMTVAQALVKFLDQQYLSIDGVENKLVSGISVIFGHGIVIGLGEALLASEHQLKVYQGKNEQGQAHMAIGYAKQNNRQKIIAVSASVGPGSANMLTAAATATANNIPLLLLPADTFASRQPDPVLQQLEQSYDQTLTTNDAFRPLSRYFDRINRPEQLMSALIQGMRVLTNPANTGAVTISLPQDVQGESYDYPEHFFAKRVHVYQRYSVDDALIEQVVDLLGVSSRPLIICGGGVKYSLAHQTLFDFVHTFKIPFAETQAGKSAILSDDFYNLGGIGVTGNLMANSYAANADLVIGIGTRLTDFTTGSKQLFSGAKLVQINLKDFDSYKMDALALCGDAKTVLLQLKQQLLLKAYSSDVIDEVALLKKQWSEEYSRLINIQNKESIYLEVKHDFHHQIAEFYDLTNSKLAQTRVLGVINSLIAEDAIVVGASGSLPGDMQRIWQCKGVDGYHMEYGYSCMGYEIAAALGAKIAKPHQDVYAFVGDAAFMMMHSELFTSIQEGQKIHVIVFDNMSNGCINNLQMNSGMSSYVTDFRKRSELGNLDGDYLPVSYAAIAKGYGCVAYTITNEQELIEALAASKEVACSVVFDIKVLPKSMTDGYKAWWNIGLASESNLVDVKEKYAQLLVERAKARKY